MKLKEFIQKLKSIKLTESEKTAIKQNVLNFISPHPVRSLARAKGASLEDLGEATSNGTVRSDIKPRLNYGSNMFLTNLNFGSIMAILLILSVLVSGGIAVGAEHALPGDILYPVKVDVNEEVRGWLATSEEAKGDWEIKRTEKRLEEAEQLADEGSLNTEASENIEANFEAHAQRVRERVEKFKNKENFNAAASLSLNFETALKTHDKILSRLANKKGNIIEVQVKLIRARIKSEVSESVKERKQINIQLRGEAAGSVDVNDKDETEEIDSETEIRGDVNYNRDSIKADGNLNLRLGL